MPIIPLPSGHLAWRRYTPRAVLLRWFGWLLGVLLVVQCWEIMNADTIWEFVYDAPTQAGDLLDLVEVAA